MNVCCSQLHHYKKGKFSLSCNVLPYALKIAWSLKAATISVTVVGFLGKTTLEPLYCSSFCENQCSHSDFYYIGK